MRTDPVFRGGRAEEVFLYHDWRKDTVPVGTVPGAYCGRVSGGRYTSDIGAEVNRCVWWMEALT